MPPTQMTSARRISLSRESFRVQIHELKLPLLRQDGGQREQAQGQAHGLLTADLAYVGPIPERVLGELGGDQEATEGRWGDRGRAVSHASGFLKAGRVRRTSPAVRTVLSCGPLTVGSIEDAGSIPRRGIATTPLIKSDILPLCGGDSN